MRLGKTCAVFSQCFCWVKLTPLHLLSFHFFTLIVSFLIRRKFIGRVKHLLCKFFRFSNQLIFAFRFSATSGFGVSGRCGGLDFLAKFSGSLLRVCFSFIGFVAFSHFGFLRSRLRQAGFFVRVSAAARFPKQVFGFSDYCTPQIFMQ